jgi:hypothetical protein
MPANATHEERILLYRLVMGISQSTIVTLILSCREEVSLGSVSGFLLYGARLASALLLYSETSIIRNLYKGPFSVPCSQGLNCVLWASFPTTWISYEPVRSNSLRFWLPTRPDLHLGVISYDDSIGLTRLI